MKFLLLLPKVGETDNAGVEQRTRVFLEDGTELTDLIGFEASTEQEFMFMSGASVLDRHPPDPASYRVVCKALTLTFSYPDIERIKKAPKPSRKTRNSA